MSEQLRSEPPAPSRRLADRADPEAFVHTVGLEELLSTLRRHVWLVLGVAAVAVAATGFVAYTTGPVYRAVARSEEHTSELQSQSNLVCRLLLEKKKKEKITTVVCATTR